MRTCRHETMVSGTEVKPCPLPSRVVIHITKGTVSMRFEVCDTHAPYYRRRLPKLWPGATITEEEVA